MEQPVADPFLKRPVLEAIGLKTRALVSPEADKFYGTIYVERLIGSFAEK